MAVSSRRMHRGVYEVSKRMQSDVVFYRGTNFTSEALYMVTGDERRVLTNGFDNTIRSVYFMHPAKVYLYENADFDGSILFVDGIDILDVNTRYFQSNWPFGDNISSIQIRSSDYVAPKVTNPPVLSFTGNYTLPVLAQSEVYSNANISDLSYDIQDEVTYNAFMQKMGTDTADETANDTRLLAILNQIIRNVCAVLYRNPDEQPVRYPLTALHFVTSTEYYAWTTPASSDIFITSMLNDKTPAFVIAALAHELTHSYGHNKYYGTEPKVTGACEGIAMYAMIDFGFRPIRPADGGVNWYDGYETTALFFEYIVKHSPSPEPDFIYKLNLTMNAADPTIGKNVWSDTVIASLNSRGLTVGELWTEYKVWVVANP